MSEIEKSVEERFKELEKKFSGIKLRETPLFSEEAILHFGEGFDHALIGIISYLKDHTSSYFKKIECVVEGDQIYTLTVSDFDNYKPLLIELLKITPKAGINFTLHLKESAFPIADIKEIFSVYFTNELYEIVYSYEDQKELRFQKRYMTYLEPDEIRMLRDAICNSIINKSTALLDQLVQ